MNSANKSVILNFIEDIWNQNQFEKIDSYVAADFIDHSLPTDLPSDKEGMKLWIIATGKSFHHRTAIEDMVCEDDKVMLKIKMNLKHVGVWRAFEPTHLEISTVGYRYYKLKDQKIIEHWGLIDGNAIESQLKEVQHGCKIQI
jgi:predicted SnoaL-like aldol condensation-catalyzing enzyme